MEWELFHAEQAGNTAYASEHLLPPHLKILIHTYCPDSLSIGNN